MAKPTAEIVTFNISMQPTPELYTLVSAKAGEIEAELKRLQRWDAQPLPPDRFENMGAFGQNTMSFEQWLQFILMPRIKSIIEEHDEFPDGSMLAPYAIRYFDGDPDAGTLHDLLYELDDLVNGSPVRKHKPVAQSVSYAGPPAVHLGDTTIPQVVYTLAGLLPEYEGDPLESQLQTFDTFLSVLSPEVRPEISKLLLNAAEKTSNPVSKQRIEKAAASIAGGGRAAEPYNHEEAMRKYQEEFRKGYPKQEDTGK